jgi:hypothetical protein
MSPTSIAELLPQVRGILPLTDIAALNRLAGTLCDVLRIPAIPSPNSGRQRIRTHRVGIYRAAISSARNRRPLRRVLKELRESEAEKRP